MNDRAINLLEQYDVEVLHTRKGRGAIICETNQGCLIYKEYTGNEEKLALQNRLLTHINDCGEIAAEQILSTKEGELSVKDNDGTRYILKTYCEGRECNIHESEECLSIAVLLAKLHRCMDTMPGPFGEVASYSQEMEYEKHNRELRKVKKYLKQKSQKTRFEINLLHTFDFFLQQATDVAASWSSYQDKIPSNCGICHGDYQYHNILKNGTGWFLINFEKCQPDDPIRDLYLLMRKLSEKSNWSVSLGRDVLAAYETERSIAAISRIDLYYRLAYPEKFWKIVNFYYNSGKAWIPERNQEKLDKLLAQEQAKQKFLDEVFRFG